MTHSQKASATPQSARLPRLTPRGWVFLASGTALIVASHLFDRVLGTVFGAFLLLCVVVSACYQLLPKTPIQCGVAGPARLSVDHDSTFTVSMTRPAAGPPRASTLILDEILGGPQVLSYPIPKSPDELVARTRVVVSPTRRGIATIGPMVTRQFDPFQLVSRDMVIGHKVEVIIPPRFVPAISSPGDNDELSSGTSLRNSSSVIDVAQLRDYVPGDEIRRVHWRNTARRGRLMVHQEESSTPADLHIVLDARDSTDFESLSPAIASERAISVAASLTKEYLESGQIVQLSSGARPSRDITLSKASLAEYFARLRSTDPDLLRQELRAASRLSEGSLLIAVLTDQSEDLVSALNNEIHGRNKCAILIRNFQAPWAPAPLLSTLRSAGWRTELLDAPLDLVMQRLTPSRQGPRVSANNQGHQHD